VGIVRDARSSPPTFSPADNCHAGRTEAMWCGDVHG
jgi:hypothetical protein